MPGLTECWRRQTSAPPVDSSWTEHEETSEESWISETWLNYFACFISKMIKCTGYTTPILFKQYHTRREFVWRIREQWLFTNLRTPCGSHKLCPVPFNQVTRLGTNVNVFICTPVSPVLVITAYVFLKIKDTTVFTPIFHSSWTGLSILKFVVTTVQLVALFW